MRSPEVHGYSGSRTYSSWSHMLDRCGNPNSDRYPYYGALGVTVHPPWRVSFVAFLADMGPRPKGMTLDRIDPAGDYTPANTRWATKVVQANNKRWVAPRTGRGTPIINH